MTARLLVTGGRAITREQADQLERALDAFHLRTPIGVLIHGNCPHPLVTVQGYRVRDHDRFSADQVADAWATRHGIHVLRFRVIRTTDGPWPGAGPRRNKRMIETAKPTHVIAAVGGRGTASCLLLARAVVPAGNVVDLGQDTPL